MPGMDYVPCGWFFLYLFMIDMLIRKVHILFAGYIAGYIVVYIVVYVVKV